MEDMAKAEEQEVETTARILEQPMEEVSEEELATGQINTLNTTNQANGRSRSSANNSTSMDSLGNLHDPNRK